MAQNIRYSPWERTKGPCLCLMIISLLFSLLRWFSSVAAFLMSLIKLTIWIVSHRHKAGRGQPAAGGGGGHGPYGSAPFYEMWQLYPNRVVCSCSCSVISCFYAHTWNSGFLSVCIYVVCNFFWPVCSACRASLTTNAAPSFSGSVESTLDQQESPRSALQALAPARHTCIPLLILLFPFWKCLLPVPTK